MSWRRCTVGPEQLLADELTGDTTKLPHHREDTDILLG